MCTKDEKKKGQEYPQTMIIPKRWVFIFYFGFLFVARRFIKTLMYVLPGGQEGSLNSLAPREATEPG